MFNERCEFNTPSRLFHLKPIGIGTPYVESLTSFIKRLAEAHSVSIGIFLKKEVFPEIEKGYLLKAIYDSEYRFNINSISSDISKIIVRILEEKTCNNNLSYLTMAAWKEFLYDKYVFRRNLAWCPICYEESRRLKLTVYEQLIWTFSDVDICRKHQTRLMQKCPNCKTEFSNFAKMSRIGFCNKCGSWLGINKYENNKNSKAFKRWQVWVYNNIGELIAQAPLLKENGNFQFSKNIVSIKESNNLSQRSFAQKIGVTKKVISNWISGCKPTLIDMLDLSFKLEYSIYDIFTKDLSALNLEFKSKKTSIKPERKISSLSEVENALYNSISSRSGISLNKLSEQFNICSSRILKRFPKEAAKLKEIYYECEKERQFNRGNQIKNTMKSLFQKGIYPSISAITKEFGKCVVNSDYEIMVWRETLEELGCTREKDIRRGI